MKKLISIILSAAMLLSVCALASCGGNSGGGASSSSTTTQSGGDKPTYEPMNFYETDLSRYITLGKYKNFTIEVEKLEITDGDVQEKISEYLQSQGSYEQIKEGTIEEGVKFNMDYAGYIDGIQFGGGTNTDQVAYIENGEFLTVSGGKFIDGFAEAILGAKVGDKVEVKTTFPEDYHSAEVAGKEAIFYVTINYICGALVVPEYTDDWVYDFTKGQYKTAADFTAYLKGEMESALTSVHSAEVWKLVMANAVYSEIPEQQYLYYYNYYKSYIEYYAMYSGMSYDDFLKAGGASYFLGIDIKSDAELQKVCTDMVKEELAIFALMKAENLTITDEEYNEFMADLVESSGKTREEIEASYSKSDIELQMLISEVQNIVFDINTFVETPKAEK